MNDSELLTTYTVELPDRRCIVTSVNDLNTTFLVSGLLSVFADKYVVAVWSAMVIIGCIVTCEHIGNKCRRRAGRLELHITRRYRRNHAISNKCTRGV